MTTTKYERPPVSDMDGFIQVINEKKENMLGTESVCYLMRITRRREERENAQKETFTKWINGQLEQAREEPIKDLFNDLRDGVKLIALVEHLTGTKLKKNKGTSKIYSWANMDTAFKAIKTQKIDLVNIGPRDIVSGNAKLTLGFVWKLIQHYSPGTIST